MLELVLATANPNKAREIAAILDVELGTTVRLLARPASVGEIEETGATLEENARLKANAIRVATGRGALADDTGLFVDALGGAPGVHSARYAGPAARETDNVAKLLEAMRDVADRRARFVTVALLARREGGELVATGTVAGTIATQTRGISGFGYDPVFVPAEGDGRSYAEMSAAEKDELSHRGEAFRLLARLISGAGMLG